MGGSRLHLLRLVRVERPLPLGMSRSPFHTTASRRNNTASTAITTLTRLAFTSSKSRTTSQRGMASVSSTNRVKRPMLIMYMAMPIRKISTASITPTARVFTSYGETVPPRAMSISVTVKAIAS